MHISSIKNKVLIANKQFWCVNNGKNNWYRRIVWMTSSSTSVYSAAVIVIETLRDLRIIYKTRAYLRWLTVCDSCQVGLLNLWFRTKRCNQWAFLSLHLDDWRLNGITVPITDIDLCKYVIVTGATCCGIGLATSNRLYGVSNSWTH